jgi:hypothetical protein
LPTTSSMAPGSSARRGCAGADSARAAPPAPARPPVAPRLDGAPPALPGAACRRSGTGRGCPPDRRNARGTRAPRRASAGRADRRRWPPAGPPDRARAPAPRGPGRRGRDQRSLTSALTPTPPPRADVAAGASASPPLQQTPDEGSASRPAARSRSAWRSATSRPASGRGARRPASALIATAPSADLGRPQERCRARAAAAPSRRRGLRRLPLDDRPARRSRFPAARTSPSPSRWAGRAGLGRGAPRARPAGGGPRHPARHGALPARPDVAHLGPRIRPGLTSRKAGACPAARAPVPGRGVAPTPVTEGTVRA